jgi:ketosteroid isomerase-like protein
MSRENVELVLALQPTPEIDVAQLFRNDAAWATLASRLAPVLAPDFECVTRGFPGNDGATAAGLEGLRAKFLEWLEPWEHYRTEIEEAIDAGDRVILLVRDFGRRTREAHELLLSSGAVWTVADGRVARVEFCANRAIAFEAAGLER